MLQFLTHKSTRYSAAEQARMALEGGCTWIQVTASMNDGESMKEIVEQLQPICEEKEAFLIVDSDVELCNETRIHGVHLHKGDMAPEVARETLGAHAVIGCDVESADDIMALQGKDIDYAAIQLTSCDAEELAQLSEMIANAREKGSEMPIVARGQFSNENLNALLSVGVNGFAISTQITESENPTECISSILIELEK